MRPYNTKGSLMMKETRSRIQKILVNKGWDGYGDTKIK